MARARSPALNASTNAITARACPCVAPSTTTDATGSGDGAPRPEGEGVEAASPVHAGAVRSANAMSPTRPIELLGNPGPFLQALEGPVHQGGLFGLVDGGAAGGRAGALLPGYAGELDPQAVPAHPAHVVPGPHVLGLLLDPPHVGPLEALQRVRALFRREGVELLDPDHGGAADLSVRPALRQVVEDLPRAQDNPRHHARMGVLGVGDHLLEGPLGQLLGRAARRRQAQERL